MVSSSLLYFLLPSSCQVSATCPDPPSTVLLKTSQVTSNLKYLVNSCPQGCLRTFTRSCDTAYFVVLFTDAELYFQDVTLPTSPSSCHVPVTGSASPVMLLDYVEKKVLDMLPCSCHWPPLSLILLLLSRYYTM